MTEDPFLDKLSAELRQLMGQKSVIELTKEVLNEMAMVEVSMRFNLVRTTDITGISGTGEIAVGVQWPDKSCHLFWLKTATTGHYKSIEQLQSIHCYPDASGQPNAHVEWVD